MSIPPRTSIVWSPKTVAKISSRMTGKPTVKKTAAGLRQVNNVARARRALYDRILADWSEQDRRQLAVTLERFNGSVETYMDAADR